MRGLRDDRGFTLLELLIALPLALLILAALLLLLKVGVGSFESGRASSDAHYALRHVRSALVDDIVAAHNCTISAHPGGDELSAGRAGGCLTLEGIDEYGGEYTISYYMEAGQLYRVKNGHKTPLAEQFRRAAFTVTPGGPVGVELSAGSGDHRYDSRFKCGMRV